MDDRKLAALERIVSTVDPAVNIALCPARIRHIFIEYVLAKDEQRLRARLARALEVR